MTAVDNFIADLRRGRYSTADQNLIAVVETAVLALLEIQGGLTPAGPEAANTFYAGPASGAAALPAFRAAVVADLGFLGAGVGTLIQGPSSGTGGPAGTASPTFTGTALFAALTASGLITPAQVAGLLGTTTNNNAQAGSVGEYISAGVPRGTGGAYTSTVAANILSLPLTAGDYDVAGIGAISPAGSVSQFVCGAGMVSATIPGLGADGLASIAQGIAQTGDVALSIAGRISLAAPGTLFLVGNGTFTVTATAWGFLGARRAR